MLLSNLKNLKFAVIYIIISIAVAIHGKKLVLIFCHFTSSKPLHIMPLVKIYPNRATLMLGLEITFMFRRT